MIKPITYIFLLLSITLNTHATEKKPCGQDLLSLYINYKNALHNNIDTIKYHNDTAIRKQLLQKGLSESEIDRKIRSHFNTYDTYQKSVISVTGAHFYCNNNKTWAFLEIINDKKHLPGDMISIGIGPKALFGMITFEESEVVKSLKSFIDKYAYQRISPPLSWK